MSEEEEKYDVVVEVEGGKGVEGVEILGGKGSKKKDVRSGWCSGWGGATVGEVKEELKERRRKEEWWVGGYVWRHREKERGMEGRRMDVKSGERGRTGHQRTKKGREGRAN